MTRKNKSKPSISSARVRGQQLIARPTQNSVKALLLAGVILLGLGFYFVFLRPPLLPEDPRYMGASLAQIQTSVPGLAAWLGRVFSVMGGYMFATGALTCYLAVTSFRARSRGVDPIII
jgi:hypothetical protein